MAVISGERGNRNAIKKYLEHNWIENSMYQNFWDS